MSDESGAQGLRTDVLRGPELLERLGGGLDRLQAVTGAPVTARRTWQQVWIECYKQYEAFAIAIYDGGHVLRAVALLAERVRYGTREIVALGHGPSDQVRLCADSANAAAALAEGLHAHLMSLRRPWRLNLRHLPLGDPVAERFVQRWDHTLTVAGDVSPALRFGRERELRRYVSRNHHQQVRRMLNRMTREGMEPLLKTILCADEVAEALPDLERLYRARDMELRGHSRLDDGNFRCFFRSLIIRHAQSNEVELTVLLLNGSLVAYVLCFVDADARRMWNCRFDPAAARYGPGRVANNAALERALEDPSCRLFDWMRGDEAYKASMSNEQEWALDLYAWSSRSMRAVADAPRRLKVLVKAHRHGGHELPRIEAAWRKWRSLSRRH